jgi:hypothetical protein
VDPELARLLDQAISFLAGFLAWLLDKAITPAVGLLGVYLGARFSRRTAREIAEATALRERRARRLDSVIEWALRTRSAWAAAARYAWRGHADRARAILELENEPSGDQFESGRWKFVPSATWRDAVREFVRADVAASHLVTGYVSRSESFARDVATLEAAMKESRAVFDQLDDAIQALVDAADHYVVFGSDQRPPRRFRWRFWRRA